MYSYRFVENPWEILKGTEIIRDGTGGQKGYYFLNSLLMHFIDKPIIVSRISSFIFGILVLIPYYLLIKSAFSKEVALASFFALIFYPVHVQLSVVSMANAGWILFIVLALYFLMKYLYYKNSLTKPKIYFLLSVVFTILATSFRLEAWLLVFIFPCLLLKERKFKQAGLFFIFSSFYILSTLYLFYRFTGSPFRFLQNSLINPTQHKHFLNLLVTRPDMPPYVKYQLFIWFTTLFHTFSFPLSIIGFLGMFFALKDKKQNKFLLIFWCFFILLTLRQIISNQYPFMRYSIILGIFFIPFIFLGVSKVVIYLSKKLRVKNLYRTILNKCFIPIVILYFIFFSINSLEKELPKMKYPVLVYNLANWIHKNINSGDLIFTSFESLPFDSSATLNKFIVIDIYLDGKEGSLIYFGDKSVYILYNFLNRDSKHRIDRKTFNQIEDFVRKSHTRGESIILQLLTKRRKNKDIKRIIFILNQKDYNYLNKNYPYLNQKIKFKYNGFIYCGELTI
jgi:hypothetical protein